MLAVSTLSYTIAVASSIYERTPVATKSQAITLTMDTYGHLFPGQEADAVGRLPEMFRRLASIHPTT